MRNLVLCLALALSACAGQPTVAPSPMGTQVASVAPAALQPSPDPISQLAAFTVSDLQAASIDAKAQTPPDVTAGQCWDFLAGVIPTLKPNAGNIKLGAFIAFQKARDLANGATAANGVLKNLNLACAPLTIDTQTIINKLLLIGAGTAATGGALAPFAGGLGAIGASLPIPLP